MSRSQPNEQLAHPCKTWLQWSGSAGNLKYYDKEIEKNVEVALPFQFVLLDRLSCIRGWHDDSESGIMSNEVRDTRHESFVVRAFKQKELIAEGFYREIKDRVKAQGGKFNTNLYIAFTNSEGDDQLEIGSLMLHGSAMSAWMDFEQNKDVRPHLYSKAICITGFSEGKKGAITFRVPTFELVEVPPPVNIRATELDIKLQEYLKNYFKRTRVEQAAPVTTDSGGEPVEDRTDYNQANNEPEPF